MSSAFIDIKGWCDVAPILKSLGSIISTTSTIMVTLYEKNSLCSQTIKAIFGMKHNLKEVWITADFGTFAVLDVKSTASYITIYIYIYVIFHPTCWYHLVNSYKNRSQFLEHIKHANVHRWMIVCICINIFMCACICVRWYACAWGYVHECTFVSMLLPLSNKSCFLLIPLIDIEYHRC